VDYHDRARAPRRQRPRLAADQAAVTDRRVARVRPRGEAATASRDGALSSAPYPARVSESVLGEEVRSPVSPAADLTEAASPKSAWPGGTNTGGIAYLCAVIAGACLFLAFPGFGVWPLASVGVALLALATRGRSARAGAALGLVTGLTFLVPHLHWSGVYVGLLPWAALSGLEAAFFAAMGALMPLAWRAPGGRVGTVATVSGLWVAQEALRGRFPFGGFPWARLAFSQSDAPSLNWAWLGGAPLVTASVAAAGALLAIAMAALPGARRPDAPRSARWRPLLFGVLALVPIVAGALVPLDTSGSRSAHVVAVQGNVPQAGLEFNAQRRAVLDNHASATLGYADRVARGQAPHPDLVLWPENSSDIDPLRNLDAYLAINKAADAVGVPILVGAVLFEPPGHVSNAAIVWGPEGSAHPGPGQRYVKRHPAPFAEYIPDRAFFRIVSDKVDLVARDFVAGHQVGVLPMGPAKVGDVICFEVAYDGLVRDPVRAGADLLVVQTNNATFGYTAESVQQLAMSRLRAVETGRSVVHISTVGVSGLIMPDGRLVERSSLFTQDVLAARLPLRTGITPAVRLGAIPEALLAGTGLALAAGAVVRGRRRGGSAG